MSDQDDAGRPRDETTPSSDTVPSEAPVDPAYSAGAGFTGAAAGAAPRDSDGEPTAGPDPLGGTAPPTHPSEGGVHESGDSASSGAAAGAAAAAVTAAAAAPSAAPSGASGYTQAGPGYTQTGHADSGASAGGGGSSSYGSAAYAAAGASDEDKTMVVVTHALNVAGPFTGGLTSLGALILGYVKKDTAPDWARSHYVLAIRTVWIALIAAVALMVYFAISTVLVIVGIGIVLLAIFPLLWLALSIWIIVRSAVALLKALRNEPYPNPETWVI